MWGEWFFLESLQLAFVLPLQRAVDREYAGFRDELLPEVARDEPGEVVDRLTERLARRPIHVKQKLSRQRVFAGQTRVPRQWVNDAVVALDRKGADGGRDVGDAGKADGARVG